jgi:PAS domain-containing protein
MGGAVTSVEMSVTEPNLPVPTLDYTIDNHGSGSRPVANQGPGSRPGSLRRWALAVADATEPCFVLDAVGVVVAASPACVRYFSVDPAGAVGRRLVDVLRLIDFTAAPDELPEWETEKIPPLLALTSASLARGLLRVRHEHEPARTLDAISTPLQEETVVVGSLTFMQCCSG